ncbi:spermidine/putrescine transport system substrate-binding protein [Tistlia consotensis]|uniref:Putrescine-binding periplasmic protein n=1 Tax=Tistlia consotensis USBA 355 TaxID=560819 RepID=A0A1Y6CAI6_9PROT|nr:spermidine/putrescine ABC transporter substrate-binding protein [Tistlia consotensis]SMF51602.1 spermidine/putrescine transport system substrate-binding protein [Tistlia consotensis USBA 355]SNR83935.1 spermidine/putrescine transport system substrate-binding protein [Tistlia consotensis]
MSRNDPTISRQKFIDELMRWRRGSVTRRHFLGVTGLGLATAVMAQAVPGLKPRRALAADLGDTLNFTTWPNYFDPANLEAFTKQTGVAINVSVFGSNEEMLAKLQAGGTGWDVFVPTNYTISTYKKLDLIDPLDLKRLPNYDPSSQDQRFVKPGTIDGTVYAVPKDWGTTGYVVNTAKVKGEMTSWKQFWDRTRDDLSGRVMVHDYQLTTIGNALKYFGYSFNSIDPKELADAEKLLLDAKPHLFAINSDYQPAMRAGDAWMSVCWTGDGEQLHRDMPEMAYVIGREGGEIWTDFYAIPKSAPHKAAAYAFIDYILTPEVNAREVLAHGYPSTDARTNKLLPAKVLDDPILYPAQELLTNLEFGAAATLTDPNRAELMARFKSA